MWTANSVPEDIRGLRPQIFNQGYACVTFLNVPQLFRQYQMQESRAYFQSFGSMYVTGARDDEESIDLVVHEEVFQDHIGRVISEREGVKEVFYEFAPNFSIHAQ